MQTLTISAGSTEATFAPALGGALLRVRMGGADILRNGAVDKVARDPRHAACFPCTPYFGRLPGGALTTDGQTTPLKSTLPAADPNAALHGEGWINPWSVEDADATACTLRYDHDACEEGRYPIPYAARQTARALPNGFELTLSVKNVSDAAGLFGLGLHPYFKRSPQTRIMFSADQFWAPPLDGSIGQLKALPDELGRGSDAALPESDRDDTYILRSNASKHTVEVSQDATTPRITLETNAQLLHL